MISDVKAIELAQKLEHADNIDIKKTIEKASTAGYLGEKHFYCTVIEDGGLTRTIPEILGDRYKSIPLDNFYFDIVSKALDKNGIYISLAYTSPYIKLPPEDCSEIYEYDDYDSDLDGLNDDELYLMEYALITADEGRIFKIYAEEGISGHNRTEDVGIMINIIDGEYKAYFALRSTDMCMSSFMIMPFSDNYPKEHPLSLKNPINKMLIEMINETLVLKS